MSDTQLVPVETPANPPQAEIDAVIRRHCWYGAAAGLIPVPGIDIAASATSQVHMVASLCSLYRIPFSEQAATSVLSALIVSALPHAALGQTGLSAVRAFPVLGPVLGVATVPACNAALTWALGRVFAWHFARGGTLDTIDLDAARVRLRDELRRMRSMVGGFVRGDKTAGAAAAGK